MIAGVSIVRNEADILELTIRHHLRKGFELLLIADNDSDDGTRDVLRMCAARDPRVHWTRDGTGMFHQAKTVTGLAREAFSRGARWIVPFDADEFSAGTCRSSAIRRCASSSRHCSSTATGSRDPMGRERPLPWPEA